MAGTGAAIRRRHLTGLHRIAPPAHDHLVPRLPARRAAKRQMDQWHVTLPAPDEVAKVEIGPVVASHADGIDAMDASIVARGGKVAQSSPGCVSIGGAVARPWPEGLWERSGQRSGRRTAADAPSCRAMPRGGRPYATGLAFL